MKVRRNPASRRIVGTPFIWNRRKVIFQTAVRQSFQCAKQALPLVLAALQLLEKHMVAKEIQALPRPRRLPADDACKERKCLLVVAKLKFLAVGEQVGVHSPAVGVLNQHIEGEDFGRGVPQKERDRLVPCPSEEARRKLQAAKIQSHAVLCEF